MRTKFTIVALVIACSLVAITTFVIACLWLGWLGFTMFIAAKLLVLAVYVRFIRPWHSTWGATDDEAHRRMPGDDIIPKAAMTTRAISIACRPEQLWPWLVQIGYGRAGWYSYDWIDNDGKASANRVLPEFQVLRAGDRIEMLPGYGPEVVDLEVNRYFVAGDIEGGTWCLAIYPHCDGSRLVSRWRQAWKTAGFASKFFVLFADSGAFIMEQKMLRGIRKRAEFIRSSVGTTSERSESFGHSYDEARPGSLAG